MSARRSPVDTPKLVKFAAAVLVGLGVGTLVSPSPVALPLAGETSGVFVGLAGLATGGVLYRFGPGLVGSSSCDCAGECGCS